MLDWGGSELTGRQFCMGRDEIPDDRSLVARASQLATNATAVAAEMVLPVLIGAWADSRLGSVPLFAILGGTVGVTTGIWSLMRMVQTLSEKPRQKDSHNSSRRSEP